VGLRAAAVVGLERALAHSWAPGLLAGWLGPRTRRPSAGRRARGGTRGAEVEVVLVVGRVQARTRYSGDPGWARRSGCRRHDRATVRARARPGQTRPARGRPPGNPPSSQVGAHASGRHAGAGCPPAGIRGRGLWTTACRRPSGVVSVSRVAGDFPTRRTAGIDAHTLPVPGQTGTTCVHRLWTTMWTDRFQPLRAGHGRDDWQHSAAAPTVRPRRARADGILRAVGRTVRSAHAEGNSA
jgi:hypothetical protein